ncbi:39S ribosomal protein L32, mitochondrial [Anthonomus grandis grandis]|uniref:39S ribosomal protein L32, mitochondrial n=1 Tax=Anthonomus grandis grandis TaxID=2921223 RepID=UPI002165A580|nr:39S ribosomal protein L32, mitochondrial [Anthonomus grandis grandis]
MSLSTFVSRVNCAFRNFERALFGALTGRYPPGEYGVCLDYALDSPEINNKNTKNKSILEEILGDGFLYAVPKHRRTIEKRLKRKFGHPDYHLKILLPRKDLVSCNTCGDDHEAGVLCPTCYKKVIEETKAMQEAIQSELKLEPVEQEVVVMYAGEKDNHPEEFWKGKRIVELEKPRPQWFSDNLLQKSTQKGSDSKDVKPSQLG